MLKVDDVWTCTWTNLNTPTPPPPPPTPHFLDGERSVCTNMPNNSNPQQLVRTKNMGTCQDLQQLYLLVLQIGKDGMIHSNPHQPIQQPRWFRTQAVSSHRPRNRCSHRWCAWRGGTTWMAAGKCRRYICPAWSQQHLPRQLRALRWMNSDAMWWPHVNRS